MKKIFLAICFSCLSLSIAQAKLTEVLDQAQIPKPEIPQQSNLEVKDISADEMEDILAERIPNVLMQSIDEVSFVNSSVIPSKEAMQAQTEAQKTTFQKIYEDALKRLENQDKAAQRQDIGTPMPEDTSEIQRQEWSKPNFPVIKTTLPPNNQEVLVPAREHIPYLMSELDIISDGKIKISETIVIVANNQKLKKGLTLTLPRYIVSRTKERQKVDYTLINVSANGQDIPYKSIETTDSLLFVPQQDYDLDAGVYTYKFEYLADNLIWDYGNFRELYWDVTGSRWNLVIARVGASVRLPAGGKPLGQAAFVGHYKNLSTNDAAIISTEPTVWNFVSERPLFIGESLHIVLSLPEDLLTPTNWSQRFDRYFNEYGDIYISIVAFMAILLSFSASWKYIQKNKGQLKFTLKKSAIIMRYLAYNNFDAKSFAAFLLELYQRNIIDIQQADNTVLLIKRTDNLKSLSRLEQKAVNALFTNGELVLNVNKNHLLKFQRAAKQIEKDLHRTIRAFLLKLNSGYLFFSFGMLILSEAFIAALAVNSSLTFIVLACATITLGAGIFTLLRPFKGFWINLLSKAAATLLIIFSVVIMAATVSLWCIGLVALSLLTIRHFTSAYGQRNGLLKKYINDLELVRVNLLKHRDSIVLGREIANKQPIILALNMENEFMETQPNEYNKLQTAVLLAKTIKY